MSYGNKSFECKSLMGKNECELVNAPPRPAIPARVARPGRYENMQTCQANCLTPVKPIPSNPLGAFSYACSPHIGCHKVNQPPGPGRYSNIQDCKNNCGIPAQELSYVCSPDIGCHRVNQAPNGKDRHATLSKCTLDCGIPTKHTGSWHCKNVNPNFPPTCSWENVQGGYATKNECKAACTRNVKPTISWACDNTNPNVPSRCMMVGEEPNEGAKRFATESECRSRCTRNVKPDFEWPSWTIGVADANPFIKNII
jgi:hypothetical protein